MVVATVVEGPTDHALLEAVIVYLFPDARVLPPLQPPSTHDQMGTGWRGVKRWCQLNGGRLSQLISGEAGTPIDLLIIHIDADIARQADLQIEAENPVEAVQQPCPPITPTTERLRQVLHSWLGVNDLNALPTQVIFAIPAQDSETWIFASLFPEDALCVTPDFECIQTDNAKYPAHLLTTKKYALPERRTIVRYKDGKIKKSVSRYQPYLTAIAEGWENAVRICSEAAHFHTELQAQQPDY